MKKSKLLFMSVLIIAMICACLAMLACGDNPSDVPPPPPGQNSGFERDTGVLVDHVYEAEALMMTGSSRNDKTDHGHQCALQSLQFNSAFSGNVCMKNTSISTLTLTITCDKDINVPVEMAISNRSGDFDLIDKPLGNYMAVSVTSKGEKNIIDLSEVLIPNGVSEQITNYFRMCTVEFRMNLSAGENVIEIKSALNTTNFDCINIKTSATLGENTTTQTWITDIDEQISLTAPTVAEGGKIKHKCSNTSETKYSSEFSLPNISGGVASGLYIAGEEADQYYFMMAGTKIYFTAT